MDFTFLSVIAPFDGSRLDAVDAALERLGKETYQDGSIREDLRGKGVHFLSITTVPPDDGHGVRRSKVGFAGIVRFLQ